MKEYFSIVIAFLLCIVLLPLIIFLIVFVCVFDKQWPIFKQNRVGLNQKIFTIYKIKTFKHGKESNIGKRLRNWKLDELLQLINIVTGTMNFIGPRPLIDSDFNLYSENSQQIISSVKPGLTGLSAIYYFDESKKINPSFVLSKEHLELSFIKKTHLNLEYI